MTIVVTLTMPLGRVMDACVTSVISVTLRMQRSVSRIRRRVFPVLRSRAGGTNMLAIAPSNRRHHVTGSPSVSAARESVELLVRPPRGRIASSCSFVSRWLLS